MTEETKKSVKGPIWRESASLIVCTKNPKKTDGYDYDVSTMRIVKFYFLNINILLKAAAHKTFRQNGHSTKSRCISRWYIGCIR